MWLSRLCRSVQMWRQNHAVFMRMSLSPMQGSCGWFECLCLFQTHNRSLRPMCHFTSTKIRTTSKAKQIKSFQWLGRGGKQGTYLNLFLLKSPEEYYRDCLHLYDLSEKSSYLFSYIRIRLNPTKPKTQKIFSWFPLSIYPFTNLRFFSITEYHVAGLKNTFTKKIKKIKTPLLLPTNLNLHRNVWMNDRKCARHIGLRVRRLTLPRHWSFLNLSFITC